MKKVLWFSRHTLTADQLSALGDVVVTQFNGNMENIHKPFNCEVTAAGETTTSEVVFKEVVKDFDVVAIVAPINLQQQILGTTSAPVIFAKNKRVLVKTETGEDKVTFQFDGWERLVKIEVVTEPFVG